MNEDVITHDASPDASQLNAADGGGADVTSSLSLDELNTYLGKNFKDKDTALKSLKDTYRYVGNPTVDALAQKIGADPERVTEALKTLINGQEGVVTQAQLQEERFFDKNPHLEELRPVLTRLRSSDPTAKSMSWDEFVKSPTAATLVEKVTGYNEIQGKKSILESNPRLGVATDKLTQARQLTEQARQAANMGDVTSSVVAHETAKQNAVAGVLEAYDLK